MVTRNLKRKRAFISYREPSSDEDTPPDSEADSANEELPAVAHRETRRIAHLQSQSQPQLTLRSRKTPRTTPSQSPQKAGRSRRQHPQSYKEPSSEDDSEGDYTNEVATVQRKATRSRNKPARVKAAARHDDANFEGDYVEYVKTTRRNRTPRKALGRITKRSDPQTKAPLKTKPLVTDGKIPNLAALPYAVLLQIFVYASHPLYDGLSPTSAVPWLLHMARMHLEFTKPALTALYRNPPLFVLPKDRRNKLLQTLSQTPTSEDRDYQVMVKRLELDVTKMPRRSPTGRAELDLGALITPLRTLKEIDIFDPHDRPPYRQSQVAVRQSASRHYPPALFTGLDQSGARLKGWTWNHFLLTETINSTSMLRMKDIHGQASFQSLRDLVLTNFPQDPKWESPRAKDPAADVEDQPTQEELLASALATLPSLRALSFVSCTAVNNILLPLLPDMLVSLTIANCGMLTSEVLGAYLLTHGNQLEELILNHNQTLNLSFLPDLKHSCPRLEVLRMDLNYYSTFTTSRDADPKYDELLTEEEVPSWPSTLQVLDLVYLRKWSAPAAKTFFKSLINSAAELPDLRELVLKAMVDVNWRERAAFRDEWIPRFKTVFLERPAPPSDHLVSLRAFREWKASQAAGPNGATTAIGAVSEDEGDEAATPANISSQSDALEDTDSDAPILPRGARRRQTRGSDDTWGTKRLRSRVRTSESENDTDSPQDVIVEKYVQGRCRVVDIRIDNLRPREDLFDEGDFLDSEVSGDEDWDGNEENENDRYAW
ncbi:hypothetical protein BU16DRAFT_574615 [Lophium mytilinum]|uniref:Uncharacterized protein n=1 Tax=Lophium mytilinum TaxID=390894 RepID=A0A6A6QHK8_9PEZI|nr:hypothetical protein BU16DRAFT_574615 [Lophium mytilinum]